MVGKRRWVPVLAMLLGACARFHIETSVSARARPTALRWTEYFIVPGLKGVDVNDLEFQEYADFVERALASRGLRRTQSFGSADVAVILTWGIGEPKEEFYTYSTPTWGVTGYSSTTSGYASGYGGYSASTTTTPNYGITGSQTHVGSYVSYTRWCNLRAVEVAAWKASEKMVDVWRATMVSTGTSGDLRRVFPYMVAAGLPHFGQSTGQEVAVQVYENSKELRTVVGAR